MALSGAKTSHGTRIFRGSASGVGGTEITDATNVNPGNKSRAMPFVTPINSDNNREEKVGCEVDEGEMTFTLNYIPSLAAHQAVRDDFDSATSTEWRIWYPQVGISPFPNEYVQGWVSGWEVVAQTRNQLVVNVTVTFSGKKTYGTAASA